MKRLITTPVYYVNDIPHIGHAYTTFIGDMFKRYFALAGDETLFLVGTDENGQKIEQSAIKNNKSPQSYVDEISEKFKDLWDDFEINYDIFTRTTKNSHHAIVQDAFLKMFENGDIYKGEYEGLYCISCESYFTRTQANACPDCGKEMRVIKEESYFFKLSKYQDKLLKFYDENENFIMPRFRKNEVANFVKSGLQDLSITRTSFDWGIKIPSQINDPKHIVYVWLDALMSYISGSIYKSRDFYKDSPPKTLQELQNSAWSNVIHIVGKDILRFHAIYWPAFLMSLGFELPKQIFVNGWWLIDSVKMSKSIGNVINPREIASEFSPDILRYFLMREVSFGQDGDFVRENLINRLNSELNDILGNLLNRILGMSAQYFDLKISGSKISELDEIYAKNANLDFLMREVTPGKYLDELWSIFSFCNALITQYKPWELIKNGDKNKTSDLLISLCNALIIGALRLYPIMPKISVKILSVFGLSADAANFKKYVLENHFINELNLTKIPPLFAKKEEPKKMPAEIALKQNQIDIKDFQKLDIKIGEILEASAVPKSEKLLKFKVDLGENDIRQILSGIAKYYNPADLVGKKVCVLANLKPVKIMGLESQGMILSASDGNLSVLQIDKDLANGAKIS
ncbi:MAG: methionine--tRNA ligase [Helicobacter sp.]|nr:methionine--tRNA ligase [Helicobacter sp.]